MRYLTSQDVIWINSQINRKPVGLRALDLEECIGYQYGYRMIGDELTQIGAFFQGILGRRPFDEGNEHTALYAALALLHLNGFSPELTKDKAEDWLRSGLDDGPGSVKAIAGPHGGEHAQGELRQIFKELTSTYGS